jgi:hypothetical protein
MPKGKQSRTRTNARQYTPRVIKQKDADGFDIVKPYGTRFLTRTIKTRAQNKINKIYFEKRTSARSLWRTTPHIGLRKLDKYEEIRSKPLKVIEDLKAKMETASEKEKISLERKIQFQKKKVDAIEATIRQIPVAKQYIARDGELEPEKLLNILKQHKKYRENNYNSTKSSIFENNRKRQLGNHENYSFYHKARSFNNIKSNANKGLLTSLQDSWSFWKDKKKGRNLTPQQAATLISKLRNPNRTEPLSDTEIKQLRYLEAASRKVRASRRPGTNTSKTINNIDQILRNAGLHNHSEETQIIKRIRKQIYNGELTQSNLEKEIAISNLGILSNKKSILRKALKRDLNEARYIAPITELKRKEEQRQHDNNVSTKLKNVIEANKAFAAAHKALAASKKKGQSIHSGESSQERGQLSVVATDQPRQGSATKGSRGPASQTRRSQTQQLPSASASVPGEYNPFTTGKEVGTAPPPRTGKSTQAPAPAPAQPKTGTAPRQATQGSRVSSSQTGQPRQSGSVRSAEGAPASTALEGQVTRSRSRTSASEPTTAPTPPRTGLGDQGQVSRSPSRTPTPTPPRTGLGGQVQVSRSPSRTSSPAPQPSLGDSRQTEGPPSQIVSRVNQTLKRGQGSTNPGRPPANTQKQLPPAATATEQTQKNRRGRNF